MFLGILMLTSLMRFLNSYKASRKNGGFLHPDEIQNTVTFLFLRPQLSWSETSFCICN